MVGLTWLFKYNNQLEGALDMPINLPKPNIFPTFYHGVLIFSLHTAATAASRHHTFNITHSTSHSQYHTLNITHSTSHIQHSIPPSTSHPHRHTLNITLKITHTQDHTLRSHPHHHTLNITHSTSHTHTLNIRHTISLPNITPGVTHTASHPQYYTLNIASFPSQPQHDILTMTLFFDLKAHAIR